MHAPWNNGLSAFSQLCVFHSRGPHKNLYELKPEYQHFKAPEGTISGNAEEEESAMNDE
jgi:hypothetical protein